MGSCRLLKASCLLLLLLPAAIARPARQLTPKDASPVKKPVWNPPNSGPCPKFGDTGIPKNWANGTVVLNTPGWVEGMFRKYNDPRSGATVLKVFKGIFASKCYKMALCQNELPVGFVSWRSVTNKGTKGTCLWFIQSECSPLYNPGLFPYIFNASNWYSASLAAPPNDFECDSTKVTIIHKLNT